MDRYNPDTEEICSYTPCPQCGGMKINEHCPDCDATFAERFPDDDDYEEY